MYLIGNNEYVPEWRYYEMCAKAQDMVDHRTYAWLGFRRATKHQVPEVGKEMRCTLMDGTRWITTPVQEVLPLDWAVQRGKQHWYAVRTENTVYAVLVG